jgi:hypothetical protein
MTNLSKYAWSKAGRGNKKKRDEQTRTLSAFHEAAHAVAIELYGAGIGYTCIDGPNVHEIGVPLAPGWSGKSTGFTKRRVTPGGFWTASDIPNELLIATAGPLLEHHASVHLYARDIDPNVFNSELDAFWHHFKVTDTATMDAYEAEATKKVEHLFKDARVQAAWNQIAHELQEHGEVSGDRVREIMTSTEATNYRENEREQAS